MMAEVLSQLMENGLAIFKSVHISEDILHEPAGIIAAPGMRMKIKHCLFPHRFRKSLR